MSRFDIPLSPVDNRSPEIKKLAKHVEDLAQAFNVELLLTKFVKRERAGAIRFGRFRRLKGVVAYPVTDETSYAVVLHELGHHCAPLGFVRYELHVKKPGPFASREEVVRYVNLMLDEERAAWDWARHYALYWTPAMMQVEQMTYGTYEKLNKEIKCR